MMRGYLKVLVLKILKEGGKKTGYGLMKSIENKTGKKPSLGSIYPLLEQLTKEKIVLFKEKEKKKIYSLTKQGQETLKCVTNKKKELIDKIQEAIKIFEIIHGRNIGPYQKKVMQKIKDDHINLMNMPSEAYKMKEIIAKLIFENKNETHKAEINKILKKANQDLKKIK